MQSVPVCLLERLAPPLYHIASAPTAALPASVPPHYILPRSVRTLLSSSGWSKIALGSRSVSLPRAVLQTLLFRPICANFDRRLFRCRASQKLIRRYGDENSAVPKKLPGDADGETGTRISVSRRCKLLIMKFFIFKNEDQINRDGNRVDRCYAPTLLRRASISSSSAAQYVIKRN